jgi:hypothetical protein
MAYHQIDIPYSYIHKNTLIFGDQHCINEENLHNINIKLKLVVATVLIRNMLSHLFNVYGNISRKIFRGSCNMIVKLFKLNRI